MASPLVPSLGVSNMFDNLRKSEIILKPNYTLIPVNAYEMNEEGIQAFNLVYFQLKDYCKEFNKIVRTKSNGISVKKGTLRLPAWDIRSLKSMVEITVLCEYGMFRVQLRTGKINKKEDKISGSMAFKEFVNICKKHGVELNDFAIENGLDIKQTIVNPPICFEKPIYEGLTFENVHHLDLNSSFCAGIAEEYPVFKGPITEIYNKRKENEVYKAVLTHTYGFLQSEYKNYKWAHLSKAGVDYNNRRINELRLKLIENGFVPILYNTDGIWYTHPEGKVYHDDNEGILLGQWKNDHLNTTFEAVSKGAYHYVENGKCTTVLRGMTRLDAVKPREEWTWDDLYSADAQVAKVIFNIEEGAKLIYG